MKLSIIIPVFNEEENIERFLKHLQVYRERGHELIVVDGGSKDNTVNYTSGLTDKLLVTGPGRAIQMNAGAVSAGNDTFVFLHADTDLPDFSDQMIAAALSQTQPWGRFNVCLSGGHVLFRFIETMMNWRSCLTGIATGDQVIFIQRELFERVGPYREMKLMEDIELSKRLKVIARPVCITTPVTTSSRKWEKNGIIVTVFLMWYLRLLYFFGVHPDKLFFRYYR